MYELNKTIIKNKELGQPRPICYNFNYILLTVPSEGFDRP